jgi:Fic family protein
MVQSNPFSQPANGASTEGKGAMRYRLRTTLVERELDELEQRRRLFENLPIDAQHAEWFRHRAWVLTIHGTTRIEGNSLNALEVEDLLLGAGATVSRKDALEVLATQEALAFVDKVAMDRKVVVDERLMRHVHALVLDDIDPLLTPGAYRKGPNAVGDAQGNVIFTTPSSGDVPALMRDLGLWFRRGCDDRPAPVAAALAHLELVAIHPFYDGNGRTARALARFLLLRHGYALNGLVSLDAYLDNDRRAYFDAIKASAGDEYRPPYDATPFVGYFIRSIVGAADFVLSRVKGLTLVLGVLRRDVISGSLPARAQDGLAYAWVNGSIRPADYVRITGRTKQSASRDLAAAVAAGHLVATGSTKSRRYRIGPRLAEIGPVPVV